MKTITLKYTEPITLDTKIVRKDAVQYYQNKLSKLWARIKDIQNSNDPDRFKIISILGEEYKGIKNALHAVADN